MYSELVILTDGEERKKYISKLRKCEPHLILTTLTKPVQAHRPQCRLTALRAGRSLRRSLSVSEAGMRADSSRLFSAGKGRVCDPSLCYWIDSGATIALYR